ncbi:hypothetical protein PHYBLDRAFT_65920 [Phycomyces blakesleeanus NRRL 1555(-)]|uniref:Poly A polymerase head domain-containing protein n=1 Tax=Phycomyces blakesleeanus (strain ATCC 8743b / DSM 1359 / FGSC 10004 / NBRC 33097 / NRRL 1555) TaxID=763407 RepID=A0A162U8V7_PHYB8|nr:hypothetical protein PHYBLDRAFT_65920 [Phycomyces blakesleeanus NRRL 1555(-)]OAD73313.1 hypothetical protein PHYBLDRAFT_65920 [Phycomyces blakesleeanus NRRL 1555(-)]|eukprot:XP_018291353.1 hypothetical protein PHYBLDRAFT_65920 [Phycomyces blakesleeanus NRRL 1555(-)]
MSIYVQSLLQNYSLSVDIKNPFSQAHLTMAFLSRHFHFTLALFQRSTVLTTNKRLHAMSTEQTSQSLKRQHTTNNYGYSKTGVPMKIVLDNREQKICELLQNVSHYLAKERPDLPLIESRIAGGWVRDKLLGKECHDIDVAVNSMMGFEFAQYVNKYLEANNCPTRSIAKIDSNPAKSKHLETATTKLFDLEIDFCNLRTEIYTEDSRIPAKTFGTPLEDAYRRDTTINSLFYNVNTSSVEDFTEKGLSDLTHGLIRTPLSPFETFRDDPLRVLRCIRFASRFDFDMVSELCEAAKHHDIREALLSKISRERIGSELEKMITGPSPLHSIQLIQNLGLYNVVFSSPPTIVSGSPEDPKIAVKAVGAVEWLSKGNTHKEQLLSKSSDELRTLYLGASVLPYIKVKGEYKRKIIPAVQIVLRDSLKTTNLDITTISNIFEIIPTLREASNKNIDGGIKRSELGVIIRNLGHLWTTAIKLALIKELLDTFEEVPWENPSSIQDNIGEELCSKYNALISRAYEYGIETCYTWKHRMDGKQVAKLLGIKPGPGMSNLLFNEMVWQLDYPNGTDQECEDAIRKYWATVSKA